MFFKYIFLTVWFIHNCAVKAINQGLDEIVQYATADFI